MWRNTRGKVLFSEKRTNPTRGESRFVKKLSGPIPTDANPKDVFSER